MLKPYYKKGQAPQTPEAFLRFSWEVPEKEEVRDVKDCKLGQEQIDELNRLYAQHLNRTQR